MNAYTPAGAVRASPRTRRDGWMVDPTISDSWQKDAAATILAALWARKLMIVAICALAPVLFGVGKLLAGAKFTATAVIQPDLRGQETSARAAPASSVDINTVVESQTRLIQSHAIARQVVKRLGLDTIPASPSLPSRVAGSIRRLFNIDSPSSVDLATAALVGNLSIRNERRSYLILISYTASTPTEAARIANTVASEFIHSSRVQKLADRYAFAERALADLASTYGEKHPLFLRAKNDVVLARDSLEREGSASAPMDEQELAATGLVVPAQAITIPSGISLSAVLLLGLLGGLILAIGLTLFLERAALREMFLKPSFPAAK